MNTYEQKQLNRRTRLADAAQHARAEAADASTRVHQMLGIMNGTPVLVGHHSEKRHRRDLDRVERLIAKSAQASRHATELERRAASVGTAGVSSDDPEATAKLTDKVAALEAERDAMKVANAVFDRARKAAAKAGGDDTCACTAGRRALVDAGFATAEAERFAERRSWALTNIGARIRDARARATRLVREAVREARPDLIGAGVCVVDSIDVNRVQIYFDAKPSETVRFALKTAGFRWSPIEGAWQRQASNGAWHAAESVLRAHGYVTPAG